MEEMKKTAQVSDFELMQKLNRFTRRTRMGGPAGPGMPGRGPDHKGPHGMNCPPMPPQEGCMMGRPPMPPHSPEGADCPPMPPMEGCMMDRPPMMPHGPEGADRPPMPPMEGTMTGRPPMGPHGMRHPPLTREQLLLVIGEKPDGIRQKALAEKLGINQSSTSELVDKLETGGYIVRKVDPEDRRATLLFLTELGQARAAEIRAEQDSLFGGIFSRLTEEEKQVFSDLLDKLLAEPQAD